MRALWVKQRSDLFNARGVLLVLRPPLPQPAPVVGQPTFVASHPSEGDECLLALWDDASVPRCTAMWIWELVCAQPWPNWSPKS